MSRTHELKILKPFADAVFAREKTFEVRKNDRGFQKGDTVKFRVIDGDGRYIFHPLNSEKFMITYVLSGWGVKPDHVVFGIKEREVLRKWER